MRRLDEDHTVSEIPKPIGTLKVSACGPLARAMPLSMPGSFIDRKEVQMLA